ncbi:MAG: hypothetical protein K8W52_36715 [Deltaproteobacteria bacterium]|nr:hypothetical protein [Deltaproteobacteria bacterium]
MAKSKTTERDVEREFSRRSLMKWTVAAGAALGVSRSGVFDILEKAGGKAMAADAACHPTNRSVHIIAGNGGFAWFQLLWPHNDVAAARNNGFSFHAPGQETMAQGTTKPLTLGPQAPWKTLPGAKQVTAFMCGNNETHTNQPNSTSTIGGNSVFAIAASLQQTNPSVIPVIAVDDVPFGNAPGAPRVSRVGGADQIVGLFNSAASRMGGLLSKSTDADIYKAHYDAMVSLNRAANRSTTTAAYATGKSAAKLLGTNLASALAVSPDDLSRYGVDGGTRQALIDMAGTLIVAVKAFKLGLTSSVVLPALRDDPHGAFNDMTNLVATVTSLGKILDGFMTDLTMTPDPQCAGSSLADSVVMTIHGDTPKDPLDRNGWPDGTTGNSNWTYVLGNGLLKTGWFGGIDRGGGVKGFDPATGGEIAFNGAQTAKAATAAIVYAIAKGDPRRVGDFAQGVNLNGITNPVQM